MFYQQYLSSLCHRRTWPEPQYESYRTRNGIKCVARVNNREYHTDAGYETDQLARENAAMRAYLICRNFSVNDGKYPSGHENRGGALQGMPVAIGTERRNTGSSMSSIGTSFPDDGSVSSGSRSGGSSPGTADFPRYYTAEPRRSIGREGSYTLGSSRRR